MNQKDFFISGLGRGGEGYGTDPGDGEKMGSRLASGDGRTTSYLLPTRIRSEFWFWVLGSEWVDLEVSVR